MKKKIAILSVSLMVAAAGVASAGAAWGKYKGYDVIRLTVNGKTIKATDAPAISFNNRTMVPIYMLKEAGVTYSWDAERNTVEVKKPVISSEGNADTDQLKAYFIMADFYKELSDLGEWLYNVSQISLRLAYDGIETYDDRTQLDRAYDSLDMYSQLYNDEVDYLDSVAQELKSHGISTSQASAALNCFYDAIEHYQDALSYLESFYSSRSNTAFKKYLDASGKGFDATDKGMDIITKEYPKYKNLVLSQ